MTRRLARARGESGFTLIELLVVILIIAILAAIAIPAFIGQRERAQDAKAKYATRTALTTLETFHVANGHYNASVADLLELEATLAEAPNLSLSGASTTFTISLDSVSGRTFGVVRDAAGVVSRFCRPAGAGGCPSSGSW